MHKKSLFRIITVFLVILLLALVEGALRLFGYGDDLSVFYRHPQLTGYYFINPNSGRRYFPRAEEKPLVSGDAFRVQKPENGLRVFVFGGSSAAGYPWFHNGAFSRMLRDRLSDLYPQRVIEVVNVAMPAVNSYTILDLAGTVARYDADIFLVYAGHNEFYGALGVASSETVGGQRWLVKTYLALQHVRLFQLLQDGIGGVAGWFGGKAPGGRDDRTLMERMVDEQRIAYGNDRYEKAMEIFGQNMNEFARIARENNIAVFFSEVVSNESDQPPFEPVEDTPFTNTWLDSLPQAPGYRTIKDYLQKQPGDAALHYRLAQQLAQDGLYEQAARHFTFAKDLDGLRFRASEDINRIIRRVARTHNFPVVALKQHLRDLSEHGLIGNNWMLEHLHPNLRGQFETAKAFARSIAGELPDGASMARDSVYYNRLGVTTIDSLIADYRIRVLMAGWPFRGSSRVQEVIARFVPQTVEEKLALEVWRNNLSWYDAHVQLARLYLQQQDWPAAEVEHEALAKERPYDINLQNRLAEIYIQQNKLDDAQWALRRSLQAGGNLFALRMLGSLLVNEKKLPQGIALLERAVEMDATDRQALYNLSGAYALTGRWQEAEEKLLALLRHHADYQPARALLAQVRQQLGN